MGFHRLKGAFAYAPSAVVTNAVVDDHLAVPDLRHLNGAGIFHLAHLTAAALLQIYLRDPLTDNTQVVQIRLDAVIGAAAYGDFKFMRQLHIMIAVIKSFVDLLG